MRDSDYNGSNDSNKPLPGGIARISRQNRREKGRSVWPLDSDFVGDGTLNRLLAVEISFVFLN